jgi:anionic cell wall polymer biosynthesis LytR-Cps2A-Psr (LCP) family protein
MHMNDISTVQNNMGIKVDYYYLLEPKNNEL